ASTDDNGAGPDASVVRVLDSSGLVVQETQNGSVVSRQLDAAGNRTALWYPGGRRVDYLYNASYMLTEISENGVPLAEFEYFGRARPALIELGNGLVQALDDPLPGSGDVTGYDAAGTPLHL